MNTPAQAAWSPTNPSDALEKAAKKWFFYRGMRACIGSGLDGKEVSADDINSGKWPIKNPRVGEPEKKGFGYFAPGMDDGEDGTVTCDETSIWTEGPSVYGFKDSVELLCGIYKNLPNNLKYLIKPNSSNCVDSSKFTFGANGSTPGLQSALTAALNGAPESRPSFRLSDLPDSNAMRYLIGKRSLETFCGNGSSLDSSRGDIENGDDEVSVDVVGKDGSIKKSQVYELKDGGRDAHSKVDDIIYDLEAQAQNDPKTNNNDNNAYDWHCDEMAVLTRKYSSSFSGYIIYNYNKQLADYFKGEFKPTQGLDKNVFNKAVDECVDTIRNYAGENAKVTELKLALGGPLKNDERTTKLKACLLQKLPKKYEKAIAAIDIAANDTKDAQAAGDDPPDPTSCAIDGIGWMICPVMEFIGELNDRAYGFLSENFLQFDIKLLQDQGAKTAWDSFKNIANVVFVIFFLLIIYSQITGGGFSNYGIKRMLPRVIIAAILVNLSFIICQLAVDVSNILGNAVADFLGKSIPTTAVGTATTQNTDLPFWKELIGGVLVLTTIGIGLALAFAIGLPGLLVLILIVLALIIRKAVLLLLIVVSPLAFVAYLLPNTEDWFKKWWKLFYTLLMVYPIIGLLFGASALAARIINDTANNDVLIQLTALGVSVLPLFAVPVVLKTAMSGIGSIGARINNMTNRASGSATANIKKGRSGEALTALSARRQQTKLNRRLGGGRVAEWGRSRQANGKRGGAALEWLGSRQQAFDSSRIGQRLGGDRGAAAATAAVVGASREEVQRQQILQGEENIQKLFATLGDEGKSAEQRAAAFNEIMDRGGDQHVHEALNYMGTNGGKDIKTIQQKTAEALSKRKPKGVGATDLANYKAGDYSGGYEDKLLSRLKGGKIGAADFASMSTDELVRSAEALHTAGQAGDLSQEQYGSIVKELQKVQTTDSLKGSMTAERERLFNNIVQNQAPAGNDRLQNMGLIDPNKVDRR